MLLFPKRARKVEYGDKAGSPHHHCGGDAAVVAKRVHLTYNKNKQRTLEAF